MIVAWGLPLRVTSGWRNPRRNDRVGGVLNSAHQTGDAVDLNPSREKANWPEKVPTYRQAQNALLGIANDTLDSSYDVLLHGGV